MNAVREQALREGWDLWIEPSSTIGNFTVMERYADGSGCTNAGFPFSTFCRSHAEAVRKLLLWRKERARQAACNGTLTS